MDKNVFGAIIAGLIMTSPEATTEPEEVELDTRTYSEAEADYEDELIEDNNNIYEGEEN